TRRSRSSAGCPPAPPGSVVPRSCAVRPSRPPRPRNLARLVSFSAGRGIPRGRHASNTRGRGSTGDEPRERRRRTLGAPAGRGGAEEGRGARLETLRLAGLLPESAVRGAGPGIATLGEAEVPPARGEDVPQGVGHPVEAT